MLRWNWNERMKKVETKYLVESYYVSVDINLIFISFWTQRITQLSSDKGQIFPTEIYHVEMI